MSVGITRACQDRLRANDFKFLLIEIFQIINKYLLTIITFLFTSGLQTEAAEGVGGVGNRPRPRGVCCLAHPSRKIIVITLLSWCDML